MRMYALSPEQRSALAGIRLLALDIDGTLLTDGKRLTGRTAAALKNAIAAGLEVALATGRPASGLPPELLSLPGIRYAITSNGAVTADLSAGKILRAALMDPGIALEIARLPMERGLLHSVFVRGAGYCEEPYFSQQLACFRGTALEPYIRKSRKPAESLAALLESSDGAENIWFTARSPEQRAELDRLIRRTWPVRTVMTYAADLEVSAPEADKGLALAALAAQLGIRREEILAMGDSGNDLGLFRAAGVAAAMGNASAAVKQAAALVADSNNDDGAAKLLELTVKLKKP